MPHLEIHHGCEIDAILEVEPLHIAIDGLADQDGGLGQHCFELLDSLCEGHSMLLDELFRQACQR